MLHLSLLSLPKADARWRNLTRYQAHQLVWKAFPDHQRAAEQHGSGQDAPGRPFLFHLADHTDRYGLLVQSTDAPDWNAVGADVPTQHKTTDPSQVQVNDRFSFSLSANPTAMREYPDGKRRRVSVAANPELRRDRAEGRGVDLPDDELDRETTLLRWLERQGERGGFRLEGSVLPDEDRICHAGPTITHRLYRDPRQRKAPITIHACDFTGRLRVTDPDAFVRARVEGIGRSKGFGFGLLMATPLAE
jgi:CRISPR system Cascade subunit CasE